MTSPSKQAREKQKRYNLLHKYEMMTWQGKQWTGWLPLDDPNLREGAVRFKDIPTLARIYCHDTHTTDMEAAEIIVALGWKPTEMNTNDIPPNNDDVVTLWEGAVHSSKIVRSLPELNREDVNNYRPGWSIPMTANDVIPTYRANIPPKPLAYIPPDMTEEEKEKLRIFAGQTPDGIVKLDEWLKKFHDDYPNQYETSPTNDTQTINLHLYGSTYTVTRDMLPEQMRRQIRIQDYQNENTGADEETAEIAIALGWKARYEH